MTSETPAANILGTIGTVCWCIQMIPQIVHNYRNKNCEGLQPLMLFLWSASGVPFSIFFVSRNASIPIQIQPQCFTFLCLVTWAQTLHYPPVSQSKKKTLVYVSAFVIVSVALEVGFIIPLKKAYEKGIMWPSLIFGIIAAILLAIGLLPPYFELAKRQGRVVGINFVFLTLDFSGAFFSVLSVAFAKEVDILGIIIYCVVGFLELGIFASHFVWYLRIGRKMSSKKNEGDEEDGLALDTEETTVGNLVKAETQETTKTTASDDTIA